MNEFEIGLMNKYDRDAGRLTPIEKLQLENDSLRSQLAEAQAEVAILKGQLEEAGKALSGLRYTPSSDDSGSYDSLIPDEYL